MAARIETEGGGESAQSRAILKFSCRRPENAAFRAVCLRIVGIQGNGFAQGYFGVAHPVWRGAPGCSHEHESFREARPSVCELGIKFGGVFEHVDRGTIVPTVRAEKAIGSAQVEFVGD